ncbi:sodium:solute symporter [Parafilimonas terrae]|uniref:Solute:Na+ symporter, SSS family n=1 Tax=Parafilimonas terrae TaxID=1465490 RepID=A0A1I5TRC8_9BACT|nr:sodium:solute symporter [Parafilimonas terrae]SFP84896.1 solute:Na+ symporter, SSS family [Parafilimonas terrae]
MNNMPLLDIIIILIYLAAMVLVGFYFLRKNKNAEQFTKASGKIPGWAIGLSIYATFLSSNTFLGVPGKAFGSNWNAFVFSISMPFAAWIASKYFVPFYRKSGNISAYEHFEKRFGAWARTYTVICFLLTQLARIGSVFFGIALSLQALTGYSMSTIMIVVGICIIVYTVMGGIEAVIWTEVVQAIIKTLGALLILYLLLRGIPGGITTMIEIGKNNHKFSLGSLSPNFTESTFWVILFYGFFINLNNFGIDQNYVQRYHTATSAKEAKRSVWLCVFLYVPASLLFFIIGTSLFAFYHVHPELIESVRQQAAIEKLTGSASARDIASLAANLKPDDYGDKVLPHFMVTQLPSGVTGLIISAILSAAMSTISSGMNASATVFTEDIYKRYFHRTPNEKQKLRTLYISTIVFGLMGLSTGIAMIGVKSLLDIWWTLSGIFAGGMLGLFLLGIISKRATGHAALTATIIGVVVILWMTFSANIPARYAFLRNPLHQNMIIVIGTLIIFLMGLLLSAGKRKVSTTVINEN